jgi:hypothetical protein
MVFSQQRHRVKIHANMLYMEMAREFMINVEEFVSQDNKNYQNDDHHLTRT